MAYIWWRLYKSSIGLEKDKKKKKKSEEAIGETLYPLALIQTAIPVSSLLFARLLTQKQFASWHAAQA
jgi:hypothetical protein